jgi:hypothetical protein
MVKAKSTGIKNSVAKLALNPIKKIMMAKGTNDNSKLIRAASNADIGKMIGGTRMLLSIAELSVTEYNIWVEADEKNIQKIIPEIAYNA